MNTLRRTPRTRLQALDVRHPGLCAKVDAMFEGFYSNGEVVHMIASHYGERLSYGSVARYKRLHWQVQRELIREMSTALAAHRANGRSAEA